MNIELSQYGNKLKLSKVPNFQALKVPDPIQQPYRYGCYLRIEVLNIETKQPKIICKGSAVRIADYYVLTAAHNVDDYLKVKQKMRNTNTSNKFSDNCYIKQGMHGQNHFGHFKMEEIYISKSYQKQKKKDFALIKISHFNPESSHNEQRYPAVVSLDQQLYQQIKTIYVYGYPVQPNRLEYLGSDKTNSDVYMKNMYGSKGPPKQITSPLITYMIPTELGTSGSGVFANYLTIGEFIIIGLHKGSKLPQEEHNLKAEKYDEQYYNFGTCCVSMMNQLNDIGYEKHKRPFVFTLKTLILRQLDEKLLENRLTIEFNCNKYKVAKMNEQEKVMQNLVLIKNQFNAKDILVLTSFDLSKVKRIQLTHNQFGNDGLKLLLRRNYPHLRSLYLNQNKITSLEGLSEEHWKHIQKLKTLSLTNNSLVELPQHILLLKNLQRFCLNYNKFEDIPESLMKYCFQDLQATRKIQFFGNKFSENMLASIILKSEVITNKTKIQFQLFDPSFPIKKMIKKPLFQ